MESEDPSSRGRRPLPPSGDSSRPSSLSGENSREPIRDLVARARERMGASSRPPYALVPGRPAQGGPGARRLERHLKPQRSRALPPEPAREDPERNPYLYS